MDENYFFLNQRNHPWLKMLSMNEEMLSMDKSFILQFYPWMKPMDEIIGSAEATKLMGATGTEILGVGIALQL